MSVYSNNCEEYYIHLNRLTHHDQKLLRYFIIFWLCKILCLFGVPIGLKGAALTDCNPMPVLNEIMASNTATIMDRDGDYPDWIEIFNPSEVEISLTGYGLSDDPSEPFKWRFPTTILSPGEFKLIFASGKNYLTEDQHLHTNFKIKSAGESLLLSDTSGSVVDQVMTAKVSTDISWGRQPDGGVEWFFYDEPTPTSSNISAGYSAFSSPVVFSHAGGFYNGNLSLEITSESQSAEIRYSIDCSEPTSSSFLYSEPILIHETTVIRARTFEAGMLPGKVTTHTYFINENITLPVVSLATNREHLFDRRTGIYENFWDDWERPIHFELFELDGQQVVNVDAGIKIGGGLTRRRPQKTFRIYLRPRYGYDRINHQVFPDLPIFDFTTLFLRNSGNDWDQTHFRDGFLQTLVKDLDMDIQAYRPAVTFLNGEYWGILNIRERLTEDYLATHYGVDPDYVDLLEIAHPNNYVSVIEGDLEKFNSMYDYIRTNDFSDDAHYEHIKTQLDINNFIDYVICEIYFNNTDWPTNNVKFWRPRTDMGKFRWMLFDLDWSYGYQRLRRGNAVENTYKHNSLAWATASNRLHLALMLRKFLENSQFKTEFIIRFAHYLNTTFHPDKVISLLTNVQAKLDPEMPRHYDKFKNEPLSYWYQCIDIVENFAKNRPHYLREHIKTFFNLIDTAHVQLSISPADVGNIFINKKVITEYPWQGIYFTDVPVTFSASPNLGYRFAGWTGYVVSDSATVTRTLSAGISLTAHFEKDSDATNVIVINEINYNSPEDFDPGDWIELYNAIDEPVDISGWAIKDRDDAIGFVPPQNTIVDPDDYLVLCEDSKKFNQLFPEVTNYIGDLGFNLSNGGEQLILVDAHQSIIDSLTYDDSPPWPVPPDGHGPTLMLRNSHLDNSDPESWMSSNPYGTPGVANRVLISTVETPPKPVEYQLDQNYPNPFNNGTTITYHLWLNGHVKLNVFDIADRHVASLADSHHSAGVYSIVWNCKNKYNSQLASGIYFACLKIGSYSETIKLIFLQ